MRPRHPHPVTLRLVPALAALALAAGATPAFAAADTAAVRSLLPRFVLIPAGAFTMGSSPRELGSRENEQPPHTVTLSRGFRLAATEVTRTLWRAVMDRGAGYFAACGDDCPAEMVSWYDALAFCNALSRRLGLEPAYAVTGDSLVVWNREADGFRLPTEAEWEYACRAGTTTPYATGRCLTTDQANFKGYEPDPGCPAGLFREEPVPVASFAPNAWGLHDMHGNVHEWCWDAFAPYPDRAVRDPAADGPRGYRVLRGGGWVSHAQACRSAIRYFIPPDKRYDFVGLRLARSASPHGGAEEAAP